MRGYNGGPLNHKNLFC